MKIKLLAVAALAVCGTGAFAATAVVNKCTTAGAAATDLANMVTSCAPEVTLYIAGASAQQPAVQKLLGTTDAVFDTAKLAIVAKSTGATVNGVATLSDLGAKATEIFYGIGSSALGADYAGKRLAVVFNTSNGSLSGVKAMVEGKDTTGVSGSAGGDNLSQGLVTTAMASKGLTIACAANTATSLTAADGTAKSIPTYNCGGNGFNYVKTAPAGGAAGVQLALADVAPNQAMPGVLKIGSWTAAKFPVTATAMQGFGVMVNDKALKALIGREVANGRLPSSCVAANIFGSNEAVKAAKEATPANSNATIITAACQPGLTHADMAALVSGKATPASISGTTDDATPIVYNRRVDFSGTQASSNIQFAGQAAMEFWDGKKASTGYLTLSDAGAALADGSYTKTTGSFTTNAKVGSGDVITAVSGNTSGYAFGVLSLEKVWTPNVTKVGTGAGLNAASGLKGASWVKVGGISPNYDMAASATATSEQIAAFADVDLKQRVGMNSGYPFQYEMVAIIPATLTSTSATAANKVLGNLATKVVNGLMDPTWNLAGLAYFETTSATAAQAAKYTRGGLGNNYAPLIAK